MSHWSDTLASRLEALLRKRPDGISEHDLIRHLRREGCSELPELGRRDLHGLFRTHFRLFHVLYRLRERLRAAQAAELVPDPMRIRLLPWRPGADGLDYPDALAAYYSDLSHLDATGPEDVARMVSGLQMRQRQAGRRAEALAVLGLDDPATADQIRQRYRQLAMRWHPDRGGDAGRFQALQEAMGILGARRKEEGGR